MERKMRRALITGGSRGIGAAIVQKFSQEDVDVVAPTRAQLDLLSNESIDGFLASLNSPIDIIVNNAGINVLASATEIADGDIRDALQTNLVAPLRLTRKLAPQMMARGFGRVVNISSIFSLVSKRFRVSYSASKAGLNGLTRTLAVEMAPFNVLVNAVAPGYVDTELTRQNNSAQDLQAICTTIPMGRLAQTSEIAEVVFFLCSDKNTYITGQVIVVDGGFTCL
ncbi:MAG TPA: SDR family oxidoreductase [Syntrophobacteria bacterium]|nr:SDR family oxidoreductase [Syntrophobacteria bacterium]